ncbi:MAG TPA: LLM class flavin-dependent oxidoreductase [Thermomicrobiales bacterium]|nr:LLM class flavin-dependent oxidoreductase [Thermomicrobiales bacterium]
MELGYFTMPLHPPGSDIGRTMAADVAQLVALERFGYAEAWIGEHFTSKWENVPCPDLLIAQALAQTERIALGTGVSCLPNHNPVTLAHRIAQLDQMARGRFRWGIGSGGFPGDFELFDIDTQHLEQRALTREVLDAVLALWDDPQPGPVEHPRWRYRVPEPQDDIGLQLHLRPFQRPHPPIAVAGVGPRSDMLTLAGQRGWIPMSINYVTPATLKAHWETYAASAAQAGRAADRAIWRVSREVYIGETPERARRDVLDGVLGRDWREYFLPLLRKNNMMIGPKLDPAMPDEAVTPEYLCEHIWIVGDVDEVTDKLRDLYATVGGFGTLLVIGHEWEPEGPWRRSMELLATEVAPRLRDEDEQNPGLRTEGSVA